MVGEAFSVSTTITDALPSRPSVRAHASLRDLCDGFVNNEYSIEKGQVAEADEGSPPDYRNLINFSRSVNISWCHRDLLALG